MDSLHLICVRESSAKQLTAEGATIAVRISGQSFAFGTEAFKKAKEVASLVSALMEAGLAKDDIQLHNVSIAAKSGLLSKESSATYDLRVECQSVELLGGYLAAISSQKNAELTAIAWRYAEAEQTKRDVIQLATRAARDSAQAVADALGIPLRGVHKLTYDVSGFDTELRIARLNDFMHGPRRRKAGPEDLESMSLSHVTTITAEVAAEFMVDTFAQKDA